jgi:protein lifeguard
VLVDPNQQQFYGQTPYPPPPQQPGFNTGPYNPAYPNQSQQPPDGMYSGYQDPENDKNYDFNDESIRRGFIRKVYSILCVSSDRKVDTNVILRASMFFTQQVQLTITLGFISLFTFHEGTKLWVKQHPEMIWISLGVLLVTMISMACCEKVRRNFPMNFIFLGLFTLAQSFVLGTMSARYTGQEILLAVGITAGVCFALTIFAFQTKIDFTVMGGTYGGNYHILSLN